MEKIMFETDEEGIVEFFVLEQTRINGINYLMVTESDDEGVEEAVAYILKDTSASTEEEAVYENVDIDIIVIIEQVLF